MSLRESLATFALCVLIALSSVEALNIRKRDADVDNVQISHNYDASAPSKPFRVRIATYTEETTTLLTPVNSFLLGDETPVWHAYTKDGKVVYERRNVDILKDSIMFYHDRSTNNSAVLVRGGERGPEFVGQIGKFGIVPSTTPDAAAGKEKRSVTDNGMIIDTRHMVLPINEEKENEAGQATMNEIKKTLESVVDSRTKREAVLAQTIHPTVLAVGSYKMTSKTFEDKEFYDALVYQMAMYNGVDLRFRSFENPAIRLRVGGFVIATDYEATPYLSGCEGKNNCVQLNAPATLSKMKIYWSELGKGDVFPVESYHTVMISTPRSFARWYEEGITQLSPSISTGRIECEPKEGKLTRPASAFHDDGVFSGILSAAYGLAYTMGANPDPINNPECSAHNGNIMGISLIKLKGVTWSPCNRRQMEAFLKDATCLREPLEYTGVGKPLPKVLPGHVKTPDEQCQARGWSYACSVREDTCQSLKCYATSGFKVAMTFSTCQSTGTPAEGTPCGNGKECIGGQCRDMTHFSQWSDAM